VSRSRIDVRTSATSPLVQQDVYGEQANILTILGIFAEHRGFTHERDHDALWLQDLPALVGTEAETPDFPDRTACELGQFSTRLDGEPHSEQAMEAKA
jgi:hypothetical protein